jgi:hypothetical protein
VDVSLYLTFFHVSKTVSAGVNLLQQKGGTLTESKALERLDSCALQYTARWLKCQNKGMGPLQKTQLDKRFRTNLGFLPPTTLLANSECEAKR